RGDILSRCRQVADSTQISPPLFGRMLMYRSLTAAKLQSALSCCVVVIFSSIAAARTISLTVPVSNGGTSLGNIYVTGLDSGINASFYPNAPNGPETLTDVAHLIGGDPLNWLQTVVSDPDPPHGLSVPYRDPPPGGYTPDQTSKPIWADN